MDKKKQKEKRSDKMSIIKVGVTDITTEQMYLLTQRKQT